MNTREFIEKLEELGYPESEKLSPNDLDWAFETPPMKEFLEWFCATYDESNVLSAEELAEFKELEKSGIEILDGEELENALKYFPQSEDFTDENSIRQQIKTTTEQLHTLTKSIELEEFNNEKMRLHLENLTHQDSQIILLNASLREKLQKMHESCQTCIEEYQQELQNLIEKESNFIDALNNESSKTSISRMYSQLVLQEFHLGEECINQKLKDYIEKQFHEEIETIAGQNDKSSYQLIRVDNPDAVLISIRKQEEYLKNCHKLDKLYKMYVPNQMKLIKAELECCRAEGALNRAQELCNSVAASKIPRSLCILKGATEDMQLTLKHLEKQLKNLLDKDIYKIVSELANMEVAEVIIGDYNLKLARQNYFISKQDQVLKFLVSQNSRGECLSLLLENELGRLQDLHSFTRTVMTFVLSHYKNINTMQIILKNIEEKSDTEDEKRFQNTALSILAPLNDDFLSSLSTFVCDSSSAENKISIEIDEWHGELDSLQKRINSLEYTLLTDPLDVSKLPANCLPSVKLPVQPLKGIKPIVKNVAEAKDVVSRLKKETWSLMKMRSERQKFIENQPQVQRELHLLLLFYLNPQQLKTEIEKLEESSKYGHKKKK